MVNEAPTGALEGFRLLIVGNSVNKTPLLATPPAAVTTTLPVVAPVGTFAVILPLVHEPMVVAGVPLKVTLPFPWLPPKFDPAITIDDPTPPLFGVRLLMLGAGVTVNETPLLCTPPAAVTTTFPVIAPVGTVAVMLPFVHE